MLRIRVARRDQCRSSVPIQEAVGARSSSEEYKTFEQHRWSVVLGQRMQRAKCAKTDR